jgi:hypothetical protein
MDVIPLDASLVKGSHGSLPVSCEESPVCISKRTEFFEGNAIAVRCAKSAIAATDICSLILQHLNQKSNAQSLINLI